MAVSLASIRQKIDALDTRLVELLSARARLAQQVWHAKGNASAYKPEREAQVLRRVRELNKGPLSAAALTRLFAEIMSACRALEEQMAVAYLGPEGTFSQEAVVKHFGSATGGRPLSSIDEVFRAVESGESAYGVVPVENSTEGAVGRTLDLLLNTSARICGEVNLPVQQNLMSNAASRAAIRTVYSHTQSLAQCQGWLSRHLPDAERVAVVSNAEAAKMAARDKRSAAIASRTAAELYGLKLLARNIEDDPKNTTRFVVIGADDASPSGKDKTSLILSTRNVPGAIHDLLSPLAKHGVSMTRLESRPARTGRWEYVFYIDIEGHRAEAHVAKALAALEGKAAMLKLLGSYPAVR
ncbi:MAG: prephenate dehydratase [Burkholderiales bacterium]|nr:prephenate dehydratase [Burkholderiales bacterium]